MLTTFLVTSTADAGPGTLRQAILDANSAGKTDGGSTVETIQFAIPGGGVQTIEPTSPLPAMTQPTDLDATTQPGYTGTPLIVLDGRNAVDPTGATVPGLQVRPTLNIGGSSVSGVEIIRFSGSGIEVNTGLTSIHNVLIGTDSTGQDLGNGGFGINLARPTANNTISDSVIAHNGLLAIGPNRGEEFGPGYSSVAFRTSNVIESDNDTGATQLVIKAAQGRTSLATNPSVGAKWGESLTLTYIVTNTGKNTATDIRLDAQQNYLYKLLTVTSVTTSQGTPQIQADQNQDYPGLALLGDLAPGASAVVTVTVQVGSEAEHAGEFGQFNLSASFPQADYDPSYRLGLYNVAPSTTGVLDPPSFSDPTSAGPDLRISTPTGTSDDYTVPFGSVQALVYTVTNTGATDATNVAITFQTGGKPRFVSMRSARMTQGTLSPDFDIDSDTHNVASIGTLAPGESATVIVMVQVGEINDDSANSEVINGVVTSDQAPDPSPSQTASYTLTGDLAYLFNTTPIVVTAAPILGSKPAVADLVVSGTAPRTSQAGSPTLFLMTVRNAGTGTAEHAVAALDLSALPAGSFYAILTQGGTGSPGQITPIPGRPGVYLVDLGSLDAGASAVVDLMVIPSESGPIHLTLAAADATDPTADPNPVDNVANLGSTVATAVASASIPAPDIVQLDFPSNLSRATTQHRVRYQLTTSTGTILPIRAVRADAARHRVTLRLAHPIPVTASTAQLTLRRRGPSGDSSTILIDVAQNR